MTHGKLLKRNGGGDRTRTCKPLRAAVFKTAALPLCDPSVSLAVDDSLRVDVAQLANIFVQLEVRVRRSVTEPRAGRGPQAGNPLAVGVATGLFVLFGVPSSKGGRYRDCVRTPATVVQS